MILYIGVFVAGGIIHDIRANRRQKPISKDDPNLNKVEERDQ
jgi:hypothetical protein